MVDNNPPKGLEKTSGDPCSGNLENWDKIYQDKANEHPAFIICLPIFLSLHNPPKVTENDMERILGIRNPGTQATKKIAENEFKQFLKLVKK